MGWGGGFWGLGNGRLGKTLAEEVHGDGEEGERDEMTSQPRRSVLPCGGGGTGGGGNSGGEVGDWAKMTAGDGGRQPVPSGRGEQGTRPTIETVPKPKLLFFTLD